MTCGHVGNYSDDVSKSQGVAVLGGNHEKLGDSQAPSPFHASEWLALLKPLSDRLLARGAVNSEFE